MRLDPITKPQPKKPFGVVDIETMNWTKFVVLGFYDGRQYQEFRSIKKFLDWCKSADIPETIFAHFGGKFDFLFLIRELLRQDMEILEIVPRGSSILYFSAKLGGRIFTFRDSSALLPFGLRSLTENFGVEHIKKQYDHSKTRGYTRELSDYLKDDCRGLFECLEKFYSWPLVEKAGQASTLASQAMRVFRTFLSEPIYAASDYVSEFARKAYLGGRTEIFRPFCEKGPLYEYDVNSLYPYVMVSNPYPSGRAVFTFDFDSNALGIFEAVVESPSDIHVPCLGVVRDGKFIFPVGVFKGHWTSAELHYAKSLGYRVNIIKGVVWPEKKFLFKEFITELYNIRLTSPKNSVSDIMAKLLMNSSYGRFGMNPDKENIGFKLKEGSSEYRLLKIAKRNVQLFKDPVHLETFSHTGIAAFVTSYARIHMHRLMSQIEPHALFYTDTDSIFTTAKLAHGKGLGELKMEAEYSSAVFLLPKTYFAKGSKNKIAMKGFDKKKISQFEYSDFLTALEGDLRRFKITNEPKFATFKSALAQRKVVAMTKKSDKQLKAIYSKRTILKLGGEWFTRPLSLKEGNNGDNKNDNQQDADFKKSHDRDLKTIRSRSGRKRRGNVDRKVERALD